MGLEMYKEVLIRNFSILKKVNNKTDTMDYSDIPYTEIMSISTNLEGLENSTYISYITVTENVTYFEDTDERKFYGGVVRFVILTSLLSFFSLATVFGNALVMLAVYRERSLRSVTNYFIVSLAAADLLVGLVVVPFAIIDTVTGGFWYFSAVWCDLWHAMDILGCTSSICHLCVISLDRFWAVTRPLAYPTMMTRKLGWILIVLVWLVSCAISFPCIAWWKAVEPPQPPNACIFPSNAIYLVLSSCVSFYLPSLIMVVLYFQIYRAAVNQVNHIRSGTKRIKGVKRGKHQNGDHNLNGAVMRIHRGGTSVNNTGSSVAAARNGKGGTHPLMGRRLMSRVNREHKAAKTLGIVVGVFIVCWLPFFVVNVIGPLCPECIKGPEILLPVITWLGYINSALNPAIYACTSRSFKKAFKRILCRCCGNEKKGYRFTRTNTQFMSMDSNYNMGEMTTVPSPPPPAS